MSGDDAGLYHVEVRQGFNVVRRFNLEREQLNAMVLRGWLAGSELTLDDHRFTPEKSKLKVLQGPRLQTVEMGLGRGWARAERDGRYVTDAVLAQAAEATAAAEPARGPLEAFKAEVVAGAPLTLAAIAAMAGRRSPRARVSEQLGLAESAVWELLHQGRVALCVAGELGSVPRERWQAVLLAWDSWGGSGAPGTTVEPL